MHRPKRRGAHRKLCNCRGPASNCEYIADLIDSDLDRICGERAREDGAPYTLHVLQKLSGVSVHGVHIARAIQCNAGRSNVT